MRKNVVKKVLIMTLIGCYVVLGIVFVKATNIIDHTSNPNTEFYTSYSNMKEYNYQENWVPTYTRVPLLVQVTYSTKELTNQDVKAVLTFYESVTLIQSDDDIQIKRIHPWKYVVTFTQNGEYTIKFRDISELGNIKELNLSVSNIDKTAPIAEVKYSTTEPTNESVVANISFDEDVTILTEGLNIKQNNLQNYDITFDENTELTVIKYIDRAGNVGSTNIAISNIDKKISKPTITYSETNYTNKDVIANLAFDEDVTILTEGLNIKQNNLQNYDITFEGNTDLTTVEYKDKVGNVGTIDITISNIDKTIPTSTVSYDITDLTNKDVTATITFSEDVTIKKAEYDIVPFSTNTYKMVFTKNVDTTIEYEDHAGNIGITNIKVDNIDKVAPIAEITYSTIEPTNKNVIATIKANEAINIVTEGLNISKVSDDTYEITFVENTIKTIEFVDLAGNSVNANIDIANIDKDAPIVEVKYSSKELTNKDVIVTLEFNEEVKILNKDLNIKTNNNLDFEITLDKNTNTTIEFSDLAGNTNTVDIEVSNIDKTAPVATVKYNTTEPTNENVTATISFNEEVTILNKDIALNTIDEMNYEIVFSKNDTVIVEFIDKAGNSNKQEVTVSCIDTIAPEAKISYSETKQTNNDVVVTLDFTEEVNILTKDIEINQIDNTKYEIAFVENVELTIEFEDKAHNIGTAEIKISNIDKTAPTGTITYNINELTEENVIATLNTSENVTITNNDTNTYTFTENGEFTFEFVDKAGNTGSATAVVDWIKKKNEYTLSYDKTTLTNSDVTVILTSKYPITINNNEHSNVYTFTDNGDFDFEITDEYGTNLVITASVNWIDKVAPTATFIYSETEKTTGPVTVTITPSENVTIANNNGSNIYVFNESGNFDFIITDEAGNTSTVTATVDWIVDVPGISVVYNIQEKTNQDVIATIVSDDGIVEVTNNDGNNTYTFTENGTFEFEYIDQYGNAGTITARVDWIDKTPSNQEEIAPPTPQVPDEPIKPIYPEINTWDENNEVYNPYTDSNLPLDNKEEQKPLVSDDKILEEKDKKDKKDDKEEKEPEQMQKQEQTYYSNNNDTATEKDDEQTKKTVVLVATTGSVITIIVLLIIFFL